MEECRRRPQLILVCRSLGSFNAVCWSCPAHLRLRWFRPALQSAHESQSRPSHGPRTTRHGCLSPTHHGPRSPLIHHGRLIRHGCLSPLNRHGRLSPLIRHGRPCPQIHHGRPNCRLRHGSRNGHCPGGHVSRFQVPWGLQSTHPPSPINVVRQGSRLFGRGVGVMSDFVSLCLVFPCLYLVFLSSLVH